MATLQKSKRLNNAFHVWTGSPTDVGTVSLGMVVRHDKWTVRGTRKTWDAIRGGKLVSIGYATRKDAVAYLEKRHQDGA